MNFVKLHYRDWKAIQNVLADVDELSGDETAALHKVEQIVRLMERKYQASSAAGR